MSIVRSHLPTLFNQGVVADPVHIELVLSKHEISFEVARQIFDDQQHIIARDRSRYSMNNIGRNNENMSVILTSIGRHLETLIPRPACADVSFVFYEQGQSDKELLRFKWDKVTFDQAVMLLEDQRQVVLEHTKKSFWTRFCCR